LVEKGSGGTFLDFPFPIESNSEESLMIVIALLANSYWEDVSCRGRSFAFFPLRIASWLPVISLSALGQGSLEGWLITGFTATASSEKIEGCALYHPRSGKILSSSVKLLTGSAGMSKHTTIGVEFWHVFIDDPLLDNCSIWHGEVDKMRQVC